MLESRPDVGKANNFVVYKCYKDDIFRIHKMAFFLMKPIQGHSIRRQFFEVLVCVDVFVGDTNRFHMNAGNFTGVGSQRMPYVN